MNCVIGVGSNLGDRLAALRSAVARIAELGRIGGRSRVYETDPVGPPQPRYLNAAVALETQLSPQDLMRALLDIEQSMGRVRTEKNGPRTIDLDVLWIEGLIVMSDLVTVPHPRLKERAFALAPLLDVAPAARDPGSRMAYAEIDFPHTGISVFPAEI